MRRLHERAEPVGSVSGVVQCTVAGVPVRKKVAFAITVESVGWSAPGPDSPPVRPALCRGNSTWRDQSWQASLDPDLSFMAGTKKVEGDYAAYLFEFRPLLGDHAAGPLADLVSRTT